MTSRILLRRGTAAQWASANPILGSGELGVETDTLKFKIGNGTSTWTQLTSYANTTPSDLTSAINGLINAAPSALDTLNELAAAINNDSSFSTTVNNLLSGKVSKSGGDIITAATASTTPLAIRGAASQTADLLVWQNNSGTTFGRISSNGVLINQFNYFQNVQSLGGGSGLYLDGSSTIAFNTAPSQVVFKVAGYASQTANLQEWQNSAGTVKASVDNSGFGYFAGGMTSGGNFQVLYASAFGGAGVYASNSIVSVTTAGTSNLGILVKGVSGQTANLQEWQNSSGTAVASMDVSGKLIVPTLRGPAGSVITLGTDGSPYSLSISNTQFDSYGPVPWRPYNTSMVGFIVKGLASQSANLQEWQDSSGSVITRIGPNGHLLTTVQLSATSALTAGTNNYLTASLSVIPLNASIIGAVIRRVTSQTADLMQWQDQTGGILGTINKDGAITLNSSTSLGAALNAYTSWSGATGIIVKGSVSQSANLQEWQNSAGTVIALVDAYGRLGINTTSLANSTGGYSMVSIYNNNTVNTNLIIKSYASQTANLQEWQNSSGAVLVKVAADGVVTAGNLITNIFSTQSFGTGSLSFSGIAYNGFSNPSGVTTLPTLVIKGIASQTANLQEWQNSSGTSNVFISLNANQNANFNSTSFAYFTSHNATTTPILVRGFASQTNNLQEWQNNAGTTLSKVDASGNITAPSYNLSDSKYLLRKTIKKTVDPAQNAVANNTYDLFDMNFSSSLQGTFYIQASIRGSGYGQNLTYSLPATYVMDWINQYPITNPFTNSTTWVDLTPLTFSPRHLMTNDYFKLQAKVNANQISFRIKLTGTLTGAPVFDIYIQHSEEFANSTITELNTTGTDSTTSNVMPNFLSSKAGLSAIFNPITLYSNSTSNIPLTIKGFASQSANLQEWQDSSANVIAKVDASGVTSVRSIRSANTIPNASVVDNTLYNLGVGPNASSYGISWFRVKPGSAGDIVSVFEGTTSQTGDLTQWKNSAGTLLAKVDSTGQITSNVQISSAISTPLVLQNSASGVGTGTNITMNYGSRDYVKIESAYATSPGAGGAYLALKTNHNAGASATTKLLIDNQGTVTINGFVADAQGLIVKGAASQSVDLQQWQDSSGNLLASITQTGNGRFSYLSGQNGVLQSLTGLLASTNLTNRINLTVQAMASQTADLQQWQNNAGTVLAKVDASGMLAVGNTTGTIQIKSTGTSAAYPSSGSGIELLAGTSAGTDAIITYNRDTSAWRGLSIYSSPFRVFNAGVEYLTVASNNSVGINNPTVSNVTLGIISNSASNVTVAVKGAVSQTADLQQWVNSAGTVLAKVDANGGFVMSPPSAIAEPIIDIPFPAYHVYPGVLTRSGTAWITALNPTGLDSYWQARFQPYSASTVPVIVKGAASQTANLQEWQRDDGFVLLKVSSSGDVTAGSGSSTAIRFRYFDGINITGTYWDTVETNSATFIGRSTTATTMVVRGAASQTGDLQQWQNSSGTVLAKVTASGGFELNGKDIEIMNIMGAY